jgi:hypothetical protein
MNKSKSEKNSLQTQKLPICQFTQHGISFAYAPRMFNLKYLEYAKRQNWRND